MESTPQYALAFIVLFTSIVGAYGVTVWLVEHLFNKGRKDKHEY